MTGTGIVHLVPGFQAFFHRTELFMMTYNFHNHLATGDLYNFCLFSNLSEQ
jgi:hypothetical protein